MANKVAIIGCGGWGQNLVRNFAELGTLAAICDTLPEVANNISKQYAVPSLTLDEVLSDSTIKGIVVAVPPRYHHQIAKLALMADKHVFVEKPITLCVNDAEELASISQQRGLTLMGGHLLRYHPAFIKVQELVATGKLGNVTSIYSNRLNSSKIRPHETSLWDLAPHDISMVLALTKAFPSSITANHIDNTGSNTADTTILNLRFPDGLYAQIFVSWVYPHKEHKLTIIGTKGILVFDDCQPWESKLKICEYEVTAKNVQSSHTFIPLEPAEPLKIECLHFLECIKNNAAPLTDGHESIRVIQVLEKSNNC